MTAHHREGRLVKIMIEHAGHIGIILVAQHHQPIAGSLEILHHIGNAGIKVGFIIAVLGIQCSVFGQHRLLQLLMRLPQRALGELERAVAGHIAIIQHGIYRQAVLFQHCIHAPADIGQGVKQRSIQIKQNSLLRHFNHLAAYCSTLFPYDATQECAYWQRRWIFLWNPNMTN